MPQHPHACPTPNHPLIVALFASSCAARKISYEKSSGTFSLKLGGGGRAKEVVQESEMFLSNRVEMDKYLMLVDAVRVNKGLAVALPLGKP